MSASHQNPSSQESSVAKNASRMGAATFLSRILGLVREQVFAFLFGATDAMDAYNIAFRIPNLLRDLFAEGAMSAAFVPNFTQALMKSKQAAFDLLLAVLSVLFCTVSVLSLLGVFFTPELVSLYAGAFQKIPGKFELAVGMTRVMFPFFPLVAMAAVVMGALNALGFFFLPAFAPALFNVASILSGFVIAPVLKNYSSIHPIYGMAVGVVVGGFLQFYVQWRKIRQEGLHHFKVLLSPFQVPGVWSVLKLLIPGTIGLAATQLSILINSIYATSAGSGAVSWLNYAFRLMQFPIGIFGVSLAAATLPAVSRFLAVQKNTEAGSELNASLRMTLSVNIPAAAGLMGLGIPLIALLFQHGRVFGVSDTAQTASALFWYALGLPGYSVVKVLVPVFYALKNTKIPVLVSFVMVVLGALLNYILLKVYQYPFWCLALATSFTASLNAIILLIWLQIRLPGVLSFELLRSFFANLVIGAAIYFGCIECVSWVEGYQQLGHGVHFLKSFFWAFEIFSSMILALFLWWGLGVILRVKENQKAFQFFLNFFRKKLRRSS